MKRFLLIMLMGLSAPILAPIVLVYILGECMLGLISSVVCGEDA